MDQVTGFFQTQVLKYPNLDPNADATVDTRNSACIRLQREPGPPRSNQRESRHRKCARRGEDAQRGASDVEGSAVRGAEAHLQATSPLKTMLPGADVVDQDQDQDQSSGSLQPPHTPEWSPDQSHDTTEASTERRVANSCPTPL